jgi:PhnB protein
MAFKLNPYLSFKDNAREAMEFYKTVFGGELTVSTFKEFHASTTPDEDDLVMHSALIANHIEFFASDTPERMEYKPGTNFSMSLSGEPDDEALLTGYFEKLSQGGNVTMPLDKAIWGDIFGMVTDKYGTQWMVNIAGKKA